MPARSRRASARHRLPCVRTALLTAAISATAAPALAADFYWKTAAPSGNWTTASAWSATSPAGADNAGVPNSLALVYITLADGASRTITYNYTGPALSIAILQVNLTGNPANTTTLNMTANALTTASAFIGYSGAGGANGTGAVTHSGGTFTVDPTGNGFFLGLNATDKGSYTLSGTAALASSNVQVVGYSGTGTFTHAGGTNTVQPGSNFLALGYNSGANGLYSLNGGSLVMHNSVYVGYAGNGTLHHAAGAHTLSGGNHLYLGLNAGSRGHYTLAGNATLHTGPGHEFVGHAGNATFTQTGGTNTTTNLYVAFAQSAVGAYALSGGTLNVSQLRLGNNPGADGSFTFTGGTLLASQGFIGAHDAASGSFSMSNATATFTGPVHLGTTPLFAMSSGTFTAAGVRYATQSPTFLWFGGTLRITAETFRLPYNQNTALSLPFAGLFTGANDGFNNGWGVDNPVALASLGTITVGSPGTPRNLAIASNNNAILSLTHPGAAVAVHGNVYVGGNAGGGVTAGTLSLANGAVTIAGTLRHYLQGRIQLSGGTLTTAAFINSGLAISWTGGTFNVTGQTASSDFFQDSVGTPSNATFSIDNNQVGNFTGASDASNAGLVLVGRPLADTFSQSGTTAITVGTAAAPRHLVIGATGAFPTFARYTLASSATLTVHGNTYVGGTPTASGSRASLDLFAGTATTNTLKLWNAGTLNLFGGTLSFTHLDASANPAGINWSGGALRLRGGSILGPTALAVPAGGTLAGTGSLVQNITLNGAISLSTPYDHLAVHGTISGPGTVTLAPTTTLTAHALRAASLALAGTARLVPAGAGASKLTTLAIAGAPNAWTGQLDLTHNALILQATSPADKAAKRALVQNQIATGRNNGAWNGPGITSSTLPSTPNTALALADNATLGYTTFRGEPVDANALLIATARIGDATLDNKVDAFDLNLLAAHWQQPANALWSDGDFTGDGKVDAFDLNALAANWQFGAGGALSLNAALQAHGLSLSSPIPEPTTALFLATGLPLLLRRRARFA